MERRNWVCSAKAEYCLMALNITWGFFANERKDLFSPGLLYLLEVEFPRRLAVNPQSIQPKLETP
jgi:hypothetical protein